MTIPEWKPGFLKSTVVRLTSRAQIRWLRARNLAKILKDKQFYGFFPEEELGLKKLKIKDRIKVVPMKHDS